MVKKIDWIKLNVRGRHRNAFFPPPIYINVFAGSKEYDVGQHYDSYLRMYYSKGCHDHGLIE